MRGELQDLCSLDLTVLQNARSDDLDRIGSGAMSTSHLHVHLRDSSAEADVSVLLVHVDGTGTGEITENNAIVSDRAGLLLKDFASRDDFTLNLANLVLSLHEVPEL